MKYLLILTLLTLSGCTVSSTTCTELLVSKVGGCNRDGYCGVMFIDGTTGHEYMPVEGQKVVVCRRTK